MPWGPTVTAKSGGGAAEELNTDTESYNKEPAGGAKSASRSTVKKFDAGMDEARGPTVTAKSGAGTIEELNTCSESYMPRDIHYIPSSTHVLSPDLEFARSVYPEAVAAIEKGRDACDHFSKISRGVDIQTELIMQIKQRCKAEQWKLQALLQELEQAESEVRALSMG